MPTSAHWEITNSPKIPVKTVHSAGPMWASAPRTHWVDTVRIRIGPLLFVSACCNLSGQCHQLKTGAFVLCEKTAKQMQLVGAGLCSARQDTPNYRKSSANPYALTRLAVEADAHIGPAECTVFTGIYGEFVTSQWADRVVGPYNNPSHSL